MLPLREKAETVDKVTSDLNSLREDLSKRCREIQVISIPKLVAKVHTGSSVIKFTYIIYKLQEKNLL